MNRKLVLMTLLVISNFTCAQSTCFDGRPLYHFAPPQNWTNDPNGLLYADGQYHLFYQHNPFGDTWGHMTWGHAVSTNLLTWEHLPIAIPEDSVMIFSGSAVNDSLNTSGLGDDNGCLVAIYTGHRPDLQTQDIAYSMDKGLTWTKYAGNPIIDRNMRDFRDPKVFWYAPEEKWVMVVALPKEYKIAFYSSFNLIDWQLMSEFGPQGRAAGLWECPDFFELNVPGSDKNKWVLMLSSAGPHEGHNGMQYFVGEFDGTIFTNDNPSDKILYLDYGKDFYAGQTYNGLPPDQRTLISWMSNWSYAGDTPEQGFRGRMTLPRRLQLVDCEDGLRLAQSPLQHLEMFKPMCALENASAGQINSKFASAPPFKAFSVELHTGASFSFACNSDAFFSYDYTQKQIIIDRTRMNNCIGHEKFATLDKIDLLSIADSMKFEFYFDSNSMEIFVNDGVQTFSYLLFPGVTANALKIDSDDLLADFKIFTFKQ